MNVLLALIVLFGGIFFILYEDQFIYQLALLDHQQLFMMLMLVMIAAAVGYLFND